MLFGSQMPDMASFEPNRLRDPDFADALTQAAQNGVHVKAVECAVREDGLSITKEVPVRLAR